MTNNKIIDNLQIIVTNLAQQAEGHFIQSKIFEAKGFLKLAQKYKEHTEEERWYVEKCIDRIIDLGGKVKLENKTATEIFENPVDFIKYDLQVFVNGLKLLKDMLNDARDDLTTFDLLKDYYKDEEEDMYWGEQQLEVIETIGLQNWLTKQM